MRRRVVGVGMLVLGLWRRSRIGRGCAPTIVEGDVVDLLLFFCNSSRVKFVLSSELGDYYVPGFLFLDDVVKRTRGCLDGTGD